MSTATISKVRAYEIDGEFGIDALKVTEKPPAALKGNEVRIRVKATSLNYRDLMMVKGIYSKKLPFPLVPLSDGAGEVVEVGADVTRAKVGDRVAVNFMSAWVAGPIAPEHAQSALGGAINGMLADHVVMPEQGLVHIPASLSFEEAATLPCAAVTAWNALIGMGRIKTGDKILTMGTGGVSLFALQFAKMSGAEVIITSSSNEKLQRAKKMGADHVINYKENEDWDKRVLELTNGAGVDHVVELGGAGTLDRSLKAVKLGGRISLIGVLTGNQGTFNPVSVLMKQVTLQGIFVGPRVMFEDMIEAMELHKTKPVIDKVFGFDEVKQAYKHMESASHFGKIVVKL